MFITSLNIQNGGTLDYRFEIFKFFNFLTFYGI